VGTVSRREFNELASPETVHDVLESLDFGAGTEQVPLAEATGRTLAERVDAGIDVPGFDRAAMDGYAVRAADTAGAGERDPVSLELVGSVGAGERPSVRVGEGQAAQIATGAVIPPGADAVVPVERTTEREGARVELRAPLAPGADVSPAGTDVAAGERCLGAGTVLSTREIGLLAAVGRESVPVRSRPTVAVVSTGAELVPPGEPLDPGAGEIHDVNGPAISAAVAAAGADPVQYARTEDDPEELADVLTRAAAECDAVLSSGSTSASTRDVVYRVVEERGERLLHGVAIKPGKPTIVGRIEGTPYVGLPGYPVSALSVFRTFVAPALRRATGTPAPERETVAAALTEDVRYAEGRHRLLPVGLVADGAGDLLAYPVDRGSGATTSLAEADGIVEMPADTALLPADDVVTVARFAGAGVPDPVGAGAADPVLDSLLDELDAPQYRYVGSSEGARRLRRVTDFAAVADPVDPPEDAVTLASWRREWGVAVAPGNPFGVDDVAALAAPGVRFCTRSEGAALRAAVDERAGQEDIELDGTAVRGAASPVHRVAAGDADAGLCTRGHAAGTNTEFVRFGHNRIRLVANPERTEKEGMRALERALRGLPEILDSVPGAGR